MRFYPLYIAGTAIGCLGAFGSLILGQGNFNLYQFLIASLAAIFMLPSPTQSVDAFAFPLNYATWSLFFELLINVAFISAYKWLTLKTLTAIAFLAAFSFAAIAFSNGTVSMGAEWQNFLGGIPRVTLSFTIGVIVSRLILKEVIITRWAYLLALTPVPFFVFSVGTLGDIFKVTLIFPIIVIASLIIEPAKRADKARLAALLGIISYPLYAVHVPIMQFAERAATVLGFVRNDYAPITGLLLCVMLTIISYYLFRVDESIQQRIRLRTARSKAKG